VTTVVCRLLHLVAPQFAVFGKKDYQQLLLVRLMAADLGMPVRIVGLDTVRQPHGVALSARNRYLDTEERARAPALYRALSGVAARVRGRATVLPADEAQALEELRAAGLAPEYVAVRRRDDLQPPQPGDRLLVALGAARLGRARLIDNLEFELAGA